MFHLHWISLSVIGVEWAIRIAVAFRMITGRKPQSHTKAWLVLLFFVPVFSLVLFLLVGSNRLGAHRLKRHKIIEQRLEPLTDPLWKHHTATFGPDEDTYREMAALGAHVSGMPAITGNQLELFDDAGQMLERLIGDIDAAQRHCHLVYYIWMPFGRGQRVAEALMRAVKRGVACRVLVDDVGGRRFFKSPLPAQMEAAGVEVIRALPANPFRMLLERADLRNHRKLAVIDGAIAYCGSQNLTDEQFRSRRRPRLRRAWIDMTVRIVGPAVGACQSAFLSDWVLDSDAPIPDDLPSFFPHTPKPSPECGREGCTVHVIPSGPGDGPDSIHAALLTMIFSARDEIIMTTPFFVPDEAMRAAMLNAAYRGVKVTLVLPDVLDHSIVAAASRSYYEELLDAGVRIFEHLDGLLHAKTAVVDRRLAMVGSANLDSRSFWLNFELTTFVYEPTFAVLLRERQLKLVKESREVDPVKWRERPAFARLRDNAAELLSPLL